MSGLDYRLIERHELEQAYALESASYPEAAAATLEAFQYRKQWFPSFFWSAWDSGSGKLAGIANGVRTNARDCADDAMKAAHEDEAQGCRFCVLTVAVDSRFRRQGVGSELMRRVIASCREERLEAVMLMCEPHLIGFYEGLGFQYRGRSASEHAGMEWHELHLCLL